MKTTWAAVFIVMIVCLSGVLSISAKEPAKLTGHFTCEKGTGRYACAVEVGVELQTNGKYAIKVNGIYLDAHGAAPEGTGEGEIDAGGVLQFPFEDTFANRGTGTFQRTGKGRYRLNIDITDVKDARCLAFYEDLTMRPAKH